MKNIKYNLILGLMASICVMVGCDAIGDHVSRAPVVDDITPDVADRLPEEQRDIVLDEALAELRSQRISETYADGLSMAMSPNGLDLPGQSQNIPHFDFEYSETELGPIVEMIYDYLQKLGVPEPEEGYDSIVWNCIDPRMNAIYDDEDKGVAAGYDNENIYLQEFYWEGEGWRYLILVRDSEESPWQVLHEGLSYKE